MNYNSAVIGLGNIGFRFQLDRKRRGTWSHMDAYKKSNSVSIVAAVETDPGNMRLFKEKNRGIPVYRRVRDLFKNHDIDVVSICVPTDRHFSVFSEIMQYDIKAVFCEKPLAYSPEESEKMVRAGREKGIVFAVNYSRRWESSYNLVREMIKKGAIGNIKTIHSFYSGQIYNIGSHLFDVALFVAGLRPVSVSAIEIGNFRDPSISGWIKDSRGVFFTFCSTGHRKDLIFEIDIVGDKGRTRVIDNGNKIEIFMFKKSKRYAGYRELFPVKIAAPRKNDRFKEAISDITGVLGGKREMVKCPAEEALLVDRIIDSAIRSAKKKGAPKRICLK